MSLRADLLAEQVLWQARGEAIRLPCHYEPRIGVRGELRVVISINLTDYHVVPIESGLLAMTVESTKGKQNH